MKKYVKNKDSQDYEDISFDEKSVRKSVKQLKVARKQPTSVALDGDTIKELKVLAGKKAIPYQVLMRSFIIEGLNKYKKVS